VVVRDGRILVVKSPEDSILRKLLWFRDGGGVSERQWRDVLGILRAQRGGLDLAYLRDWAKQLGLPGLLDRAMEEAA
jgi:hypothetical protein